MKDTGNSQKYTDKLKVLYSYEILRIFCQKNFKIIILVFNFVKFFIIRRNQTSAAHSNRGTSETGNICFFFLFLINHCKQCLESGSGSAFVGRLDTDPYWYSKCGAGSRRPKKG
jgi:hypothetical protein